jgi:polyhydroxyalkanoate synthesis regulator phasin
MILDPVLTLARKSALASVGAVALTGDTLTSTVDRFAARGAQVRKSATNGHGEVAADQKQAVPVSEEQLAKLRELFEQGRDRLIGALSLPTQSSVEELKTEVARLSAQVDQLRAAARRQAKANGDAPIPHDSAPAEPVPGYDKLNVERVVDLLPTLGESQLLAVQVYEQSHSNRVTVLRAIDKLLEAKAEA